MSQDTPLLARQIQLLRHLTDAELIFGEGRRQAEARQPSFDNLSSPHLRLEAEMSFAKRMANIDKVFRRTARCAGKQWSVICREFAAACRPRSGRRTEEALRLYEFLQHHWAAVRPTPPFIADVAKLEITIAKVAASDRSSEVVDASTARSPKTQGETYVRRIRRAEIVRLQYDLRGLFQSNGSNISAPEANENYLLVAQATGTKRPAIISISSPEYAFLDQVRDWISVERVAREIDTLEKFRAAGIVELYQ